mmetsp:Transcript_14844/g.24166  ORF Transcript_14844/g.24166 Transcript_14844/m.24166 type:complete len:110 (+) Transcript_14844:45-374(+)
MLYLLFTTLRAKETTTTTKDTSYISVDDKYCAMIIRSKIQTIDFYLAAADLLRGRLVEHLEQLPSSQTRLPEGTAVEVYPFDDEKVVCEQVNALVSAYHKIRYPQIEIN